MTMSSKIQCFLFATLLIVGSSMVTDSNAFLVGTHQPRRQSTTCCNKSTSTTSLSSTANKPDLVDQKTFVAAIQRVEDEIYAIEQQQLQQEQGGGEGEQQQQQPQQERQSMISPDVVLAIGRLFVELPIDTQPELDLTESAGPLVLVTGVWGRTAEETGLQVYDTIVSVSVGGETNGEEAPQEASQPTFSAYTKGQTLEQTAGVLTAAAQHAVQAGGTRITLEVNRLIQGFYASEEEQNAAYQQSYDAAQDQQQQQDQQDWQQ